MTARRLLQVTAIAEGATGVALLLAPDLPSRILFAAPLDGDLPELFARIAGASLAALAVVCWSAADAPDEGIPASLLPGLLIYDILAAVLLAYGRFALGAAGIGLWPAILAHLALGAWCIAVFRRDHPVKPFGRGRRGHARQGE